MTDVLFDYALRAKRRDRAYRSGVPSFLHERAFEDIVERLSLIRRDFRSVLLIGCPDPGWKGRLASATGGAIDVVEPGPLFAQASGGRCVVEDAMDLPVGHFDLSVAMGTLDTVNDLPSALVRIRLALAGDGLLIGAVAGGETLPRLRAAMRAADAVSGRASPHVHPRIEPAALAGLLSAAGFVDPVVDIDRVQAGYGSLSSLLRDLRAMGATNILSRQSPSPLSKSARQAAIESFAPLTGEERTIEQFELLHFAGWAGPPPAMPNQG